MIAMGGTLIVMVTVLIIYACCGGSIQKRRLIGLSTQAKATIISIVFISFGRIFLFIGLDAGALGVRNHHVDRQVHSIYHNGQKAGDLNSIMYNIPVALLVIDAVAFVACLGISIVALCFKFIEHFQIKRCYSGIKGSHYYVLCLTVIPLIISAYSHAPYIIMAYVSDASYASSIFIYYVVAIFVEFGVLEYTFSQFLQKHRKIINRICLFVSAFFLSVFVNAIMAIIFTFFFFIPIKYALRRAPSEVLVIYQAAIILVGGYITYKAVFEGKNGQQENFKTNRSLKNNDLLMFYLMELDEMTHSKCTGFHSTNGDVDNTIKKRAYLRNEMALTSLKHKVNFLQSEKDTDNSTEITELEDEICNLNRMINAYLEEELKLLENDSLTNGQFRVKRVKVKCLRNKIYSTDIDIIDYLREKISQWHSHDQSLAWIITIRKEMSTSIVRAFSWFADNQNEVNALKTRITNMDKSFKITEPGLKSDLSDIQNAEDIALRYGEITDKERMIGTTQDVEKVRSDIDSLWLKIVASIKERISHRKQRLQQLQNSPSSGTLIGKAQIDSLQAEIVTQTMEQTRVKLKQMQRKVECRQQLEPQCVEEYRHNTTYIITLTLNRIVYRKEAISRIQGEHVLITCTISPEHLMQIDSMRTEIIKLGMQILQMLEDESHSEIEQLRAPYAIPNLDRINLIDETCTCIGERITHLNQLIKSCSIHQHCYSTIKVEIELLAEQKKKLQTTKGSITLQV